MKCTTNLALLLSPDRVGRRGWPCCPFKLAPGPRGWTVLKWVSSLFFASFYHFFSPPPQKRPTHWTVQYCQMLWTMPEQFYSLFLVGMIFFCLFCLFVCGPSMASLLLLLLRRFPVLRGWPGLSVVCLFCCSRLGEIVCSFFYHIRTILWISTWTCVQFDINRFFVDFLKIIVENVHLKKVIEKKFKGQLKILWCKFTSF